MVDLQSQYAFIRPQVEAGMEEVLSSAQFINGPAVKSFQLRPKPMLYKLL